MLIRINLIRINLNQSNLEVKQTHKNSILNILKDFNKVAVTFGYGPV